jgi:hypothetical protein
MYSSKISDDKHEIRIWGLCTNLLMDEWKEFNTLGVNIACKNEMMVSVRDGTCDYLF